MTRLGFQLLCCTACLVLAANSIGGVGTACAQESSRANVPLSSIDAGTRWALRALSPVTIESPIIRLGDVVQPLDERLGAWQRLRHSPIGLLPLGSQPMTISRDRLEQVILAAEATPLAIDWIGPKEIRVIYTETRNASDVVEPSTSVPTVTTVAHQVISNQERPQRSHDRSTASLPVNASSPVNASLPATISEAEFQRLTHSIQRALDRHYPSIAAEYRVEVVRNQTALASLVSISGVSEVSPLDSMREGDGRFLVSSRTPRGPHECELVLTLHPHPKVAVPRKVLPRGHRISQSDLEMQPLADSLLEPDHVRDIAEVVGMEVRGQARPGRPLSHSELGAPTLVRRGDLIEVRVMGGGVTVTTNAKSHGDGAANDLVEIETSQPRKRLLARVVQPGLVEVVTRAPKVDP